MRSWLQFADDTALISRDVKSAQALIDLNVAWCHLTGMEIRVDKCVTFGMRKYAGVYQQFLPNVTINNSIIPAVEKNKSFTYLGKIFDFAMDNNTIKEKLVSKLKEMLNTISDLKIKSQLKLKILKLYVPAQISFDLKIYDIPISWLTSNLDNLIVNSVNSWLALPVSACTRVILELPKHKGGHDVQLPSSTAEKLRLTTRIALKNSSDQDITAIWNSTSSKNVNLDFIANNNNSKEEACRALKLAHQSKISKRLSSFKIQGRILSAIESFDDRAKLKWSSIVNFLPEHLYRFVRKALLQQLATASNLHRWGKTQSPKCRLCGAIQTNKHVLSNCSSPSMLEKYKKRHDAILDILIKGLDPLLDKNSAIYADLPLSSARQISELFISLRPDIAIQKTSTIDILELTVCHETNAVSSRTFKQTKYKNIEYDLYEKFKNHHVNVFTIEVTTLGFISDFRLFQNRNLKNNLSDQILSEMSKTAISESYALYCERNSEL